MILINLRRMAACSLCVRYIPVRDNAKQYGDERDMAQLCDRCVRGIREEVRIARLNKED